MAIKDLLYSENLAHLLVLSLFFIAIINFGILVGGGYDKGDDFLDSEKVGLTSLTEELEISNEETKSLERLFQSDVTFIGKADIILDSLIGIIILMWKSAFGLLNVILQGAENILHLPRVVTGTIISLFIFSLLFGAWKSIKTGES